jgi:hypothetical protein
MSKRKQPVKSKTQTARRDPIPWKYCFLTLVCGLMLVVGFFFAARSHFSSIDFGIKNSRLRKQIEELEADKRRLILSKEIALSPAEIKKAAKRIGLTEMTASNIEVYRPPVKEKSKTEKLIVEKPKLEFLERAAPVKKEEKKPEEKKPEVKIEKKLPETKERLEKIKVQIARK